MPIKIIRINGKKAYKYGSTGKAYTGPNAREKAIKQGQAIEISKRKVKVKSSPRARGYIKQI